jgi:uracil-DNA glycosylase family 4
MVWEALRDEILKCQRCPLARSRTNAVPGVGPTDAALMIVGEAPGRQEDVEGQPFVGAAGRLLTMLLEGVGIKRDSVFITNVVKCRPPENRPPDPTERDACHPFLLQQLELIKPKIVCLAGRVPAEVFLGPQVSMSTMHGKSYERGGRTYFVIYHPAAGLYTQTLVAVMKEDMNRLNSLLDQSTGGLTEAKDGQQSLAKFFGKPSKP